MPATEPVATSTTASEEPRIASTVFQARERGRRPWRAIAVGRAARERCERSRLSSCSDTGTFSRVTGYAEGVGFEPTRHHCPPVFKTGSIGHSDSPPDRLQSVGENATLTLEIACESGRDARLVVGSGAVGRDLAHLLRRLTHGHRDAAALGRPAEHVDVVEDVADHHHVLAPDPEPLAHVLHAGA